jgi:hypothetical protein
MLPNSHSENFNMFENGGKMQICSKDEEKRKKKGLMCFEKA